MTQTTVTLADFLLARIAEDEAVARAAGDGWRGPESMGVVEGGASIFVAPARVLAECEAKRQILELHRSGDAWCDHCSGWFGDDPAAACPTLRALARPYADHPDYREWRA